MIRLHNFCELFCDIFCDIFSELFSELFYEPIGELISLYSIKEPLWTLDFKHLLLVVSCGFANEFLYFYVHTLRKLKKSQRPAYTNIPSKQAALTARSLSRRREVDWIRSSRWVK